MSDLQSKQKFQQASIATADDLRSVARSNIELSQLSLPEIDQAVELVARMVPAGNVPGIILNGLLRLRGRAPAADDTHRSISLLFESVEHMLDQAVYGAFFAGPAAVLWGYQNLMKLAGIDPDQAFPNGTWQFYVEYALREDTARHTNETHGFDTILEKNHIYLNPVDRMTAWVMTGVSILHQYNRLLENEWRERKYIHMLHALTGQHEHLHTEWIKQRPYARGQDAKPSEDYAAYRKRVFDDFLEPHVNSLNEYQAKIWVTQVRQAKQQDLIAYQEQMSILSYLQPTPYREERKSLSIEQANIGLIYQDHYYLIPIWDRDYAAPIHIDTVQSYVSQLLRDPARTPSTRLDLLATLNRAELAKLRAQLSTEAAVNLNILQQAPILINFDQQSPALPLGKIRQGERGIGDHALTLFDTGHTMVFDQSHIYFDGAWGAALAEIMTNEALSWGVYLHRTKPKQPNNRRPYLLDMPLTAEDHQLISTAKHCSQEIGVENNQVDVERLLSLRRQLKKRNDLLQLTVNDLLVLYRAIHATTYKPPTMLVQKLQLLQRTSNTDGLVSKVLSAIKQDTENPTILIPVDASQKNPRERLYPLTLEVPLQQLKIIEQHGIVLTSLNAYEEKQDPALFQQFDELRREYLAALAGFGMVMSQAKVIANEGKTTSIGTLKLIGNLSEPLQRLLDQIPSRFDVLNDLIKGREVFSNVGAVAPNSTLTRFITAKDDNEKKKLGWGIITDANGIMHISLRDFRPHIIWLIEAGQTALAQEMSQHYLDSFVNGFNDYIMALFRITIARQEH